MSVAAPAPKPPPASMSPRTIALNRIPPELDRRLTACDAFVELRMKNDVLNHFRFFKTDQPPDIPHDPSFHLMADNGSIVAAMVGVLNISVKAAEPAEADSSSDEDGVDSESDYDLCSIDSEADLSSSDSEEADQQTLKADGGVHDRGCQLEKLTNHLKDWFDPTKHAGLLPTQVEELLN
ncbi:hypothetical protein ATCC90586_008187 [Pythium insidiosum]|nr:hypothetical protein ATCC90586_008187 [Pythium insidiosum]